MMIPAFVVFINKRLLRFFKNKVLTLVELQNLSIKEIKKKAEERERKKKKSFWWNEISFSFSSIFKIFFKMSEFAIKLESDPGELLFCKYW